MSNATQLCYVGTCLYGCGRPMTQEGICLGCADLERDYEARRDALKERALNVFREAPRGIHAVHDVGVVPMFGTAPTASLAIEDFRLSEVSPDAFEEEEARFQSMLVPLLLSSAAIGLCLFSVAGWYAWRFLIALLLRVSS